MKALLLIVTACSADRAQPVSVPNAEHPADAEAMVAPVNAAPSEAGVPPAPHKQVASAHACLMLYECGCNAGCTVIDRPLASLTVGMQVSVLSGPLKGSTVYVNKNQTRAGESVFTVQRADPNASEGACALPSSPLIGYACSIDMSGAARACTACGS